MTVFKVYPSTNHPIQFFEIIFKSIPSTFYYLQQKNRIEFYLIKKLKNRILSLKSSSSPVIVRVRYDNFQHYYSQDIYILDTCHNDV